MNVFTLLVVLVVWLPFGAMAVSALFVVTVLMGVGTGSFVPLGGKSPVHTFSAMHSTFLIFHGGSLQTLIFFSSTVQCVSGLCTSRTIGTWLGFVYTFSSFATLLGNPATEAILSRQGPNALMAFLAGALVFGLACMVSLRFMMHGGKWILARKI